LPLSEKGRPIRTGAIQAGSISFDGNSYIADIPDLVEKAARARSMKGNPIMLTAEELPEIVSSAN